MAVRPTKLDRKKAGKVKKTKLKPIAVKTPGSSFHPSEEDEESSEDELVTDEKKKAESRKMFRKDSVSVKEAVSVLNDVTKKHKISPQQSEERRVRNRGDSTIA